MNFLARHKKILIHFGVAPAIALFIVLAFMVAQRPEGQPWFGFVGYFFDSPLGMALEFLCVVSVIGYTVFRLTKPATPRHRGYFVAAAFFIALLLDGVYDQRLSRTIAFTSSSGMTQFFAMTAMFYCIYRLLVILPDHFRHIMTFLFTAALCLNLGLSAVSVNQMLAAGYNCASHKPPNLWFVVFNKDPLSQCSAADKAWMTQLDAPEDDATPAAAQQAAPQAAPAPATAPTQAPAATTP